eukprot:Hpha_TRINITY_DN27878_c0_g1::TRINITY_DN27878_c0_g1_i1::g.193976::m.193976
MAQIPPAEAAAAASQSGEGSEGDAQGVTRSPVERFPALIAEAIFALSPRNFMKFALSDLSGASFKWLTEEEKAAMQWVPGAVARLAPPMASSTPTPRLLAAMLPAVPDSELKELEIPSKKEVLAALRGLLKASRTVLRDQSGGESFGALFPPLHRDATSYHALIIMRRAADLDASQQRQRRAAAEGARPPPSEGGGSGGAGGDA